MTIKERLLQVANEEWDYFGRQETSFKIQGGRQVPFTLRSGHKEGESPFHQRVAQYWREGVHETYSGRDDVPWSAAFISYLIKKAGINERQFLFHKLHAKYIRKAIVARQSSDNNYGFWGYRLNEYKPEIGDLVCYVRGKAVGHIDYDSPTDSYESHTDVIIAKEGNILKVIGGNVDNSVTLKHLLLDEEGFLADKTKSWFVILKNNIRDQQVAAVHEAPERQTFVVTGEGVRLRSFPSKEEQEILGSLSKGDEVSYIQSSDDKRWSKVKYKDKTGWVYSLYLKPKAPATGNDNINGILDIVSNSTIINYSWLDRGRAKIGYYQGMALMFARLYCRLRNKDRIAVEIAKSAGDDPKRDALTYYSEIFENAGMDNEVAGDDTLRHLFVMMLGLGMRESSGKHCAGRDTNADNVDGETAEAGLFQTSYNARSASPLLPEIFRNYKSDPDGFIDIFSKGVSCSEKDWLNHGTGDGKEFQRLSKECPGFAVEFTAVAMRNTSQHWGPIRNKKVEIRSEADTMFLKVQHFIDSNNITIQ